MIRLNFSLATSALLAFALPCITASCGGGDSADDSATGGAAGSDAGGAGGTGGTGGTGATGGTSGTGGGSAGTAGSAGEAGHAGASGSAAASGAAGSAGAAGTGAAGCGNGVVELGEGCDDDNDQSGDGCSATCEVELGWTCTGDPSACETLCGDGIIAGAEACEGDDLGGGSCANEGFHGGELACLACGFDTSGCTTCNDGVCEPGEVISCPGDCDVVDISASLLHSCAVKGDGTAWCWGDNAAGQLGDDSAIERTSPVQVASIDQVAHVTAGRFAHSCALRTDGTVWCWGNNDWGQLGDTTMSPTQHPVMVQGLAGVQSVCGGSFHTCALKLDGTVWCWGSDAAGQLGDGQNATACPLGDCSTTPVEAASLIHVEAIACGDSHTCALKDQGTVWCWGNNASGQLGVGDFGARKTPDLVGNLTDAVAIGAGYFHSCAVKSDGKVWCWGLNDAGQLGSGTSLAQAAMPVEVVGLSEAVTVAPGLSHGCAGVDDGSVWCWGEDASGQLGNGAAAAGADPVRVAFSSGRAVVLAGGGDHACAVQEDGTAWCWGANDAGQLGDGSHTPHDAPNGVAGL